MTILVTGSSGLIGTALVTALRARGGGVRGVDVRPGETTSIVERMVPDAPGLGALLSDLTGIVHLAGVSRVVWGEQDPAACWRDNVDLTAALVEAACHAARPPWLIYSSSREIYGQPAILPAPDDAPPAPINVYGRSKLAAERIVQDSGLRAGVIRFSTVYGGANDHPDRVIPAFVANARAGLPLLVHGADVALDPTWIGDAVAGVLAMIAALEAGRVPARPVLLSVGRAVRLVALAALIREATGGASSITVSESRDFDVARYAGVPSFAREFLGWRPRVSLEQGIAHMLRQTAERNCFSSSRCS